MERLARCRAIVLVLLALGCQACHAERSPRRPVTMVAVPPPGEAPHAQTSLAVGGSQTFEAEHVIACEADVPDLFRAYATPSNLTLVGRSAGRATLHLRLAAGDVFHIDVEVTNDPPARRALTIGDQLAVPFEGSKDFTVSGDAVRVTRSADGAQLIVTGEAPGPALVALVRSDGSTQPIELLVVAGERLF